MAILEGRSEPSSVMLNQGFGVNRSRFYLDSNAWISVANSGFGIGPIISGHQSGQFEILISQENINELLLNNDIRSEVRARNFEAIKTLIPESLADSIFVLGHSRLNFAQVADDRDSRFFVSHMKGKAAEPNNIADGVHLMNARNFDATLISCDKAVRRSALGFQQIVVCLKDWFSTLKFESPELEDCRCTAFSS